MGKPRKRRRRQHASLEAAAIHQVALMIRAQRKLRGKRTLNAKELRERAKKYHKKHFG